MEKNNWEDSNKNSSDPLTDIHENQSKSFYPNNPQDISLVSADGTFRLRGVGIIIKDHKILMVHDEINQYYYAIGGAVHLGETTSDAAIREVKEESGLLVEVDRLLFTHENFFELKGILHHEIEFYYLMKDIGAQTLKSERVNDNEIEGLSWLALEQLKEETIFPKIYQKVLGNLPAEIGHFVCDQRI